MSVCVNVRFGVKRSKEKKRETPILLAIVVLAEN